MAKRRWPNPTTCCSGGGTYEIFAPHFSEIGDGDTEASMMNNATKYVTTNTLENLTWKNAVRVTGDIPAEVARLKKQDGPLLQVHGSWRLIQTLLDHDLVDEFRLWTFPVVLGSGKRLFQEPGARKTLTRIRSGTTPNGVVMGIYRRAAAGSVDKPSH